MQHPVVEACRLDGYDNLYKAMQLHLAAEL